MRAGIIWLVLVTFCEVGAETVIDFRVGVERETDGRLRAAGSMSGMVERIMNYEEAGRYRIGTDIGIGSWYWMLRFGRSYWIAGSALNRQY